MPNYTDVFPNKIIIKNDILAENIKQVNWYMYLYLIVIVITLFIVYCYWRYFNRVSNEPEIVQSDGCEDGAQDLLSEKQPVIFRDVLFDWEPICEVFELDIADINEIRKVNSTFDKVLKEYLAPFSLPFSFGWHIDINHLTRKDTYHHFVLESKHRHMIAQITGEIRLYLAVPNQKEYLGPLDTTENTNKNTNKNINININTTINNTYSTVDFWSEKETSKAPYNKLEYMEIILRAGNMISIPKSWWYLIQVKEDGLTMETYNKSVFSLVF
jgi:hypothetical protein